MGQVKEIDKHNMYYYPVITGLKWNSLNLLKSFILIVLINTNNRWKKILFPNSISETNSNETSCKEALLCFGLWEVTHCTLMHCQ